MRLYIRWFRRGLKKHMLGYGDGFGVRKRAEVINQELLGWIDREKGRPFFAFLNYLDVHEPYGAPASYPAPEWGVRTAVDRYDAGVKYVDGYIGRLMKELDRRGLLNRTLVIVTSDHGESLGQHDLAHHAVALYWELIHVPLVIHYPGQVSAGVRVAQPVTNSAVPATVMELVGSGRETFPGPALSLLWQAEAREWPDALSEVAQHNIVSEENRAASKHVATTFDGAMKSIVRANWHLIVHKELGNQLYDWVDDPGETRNLIQSAEGQRVASDLTARLENLLARSDAEQDSSILVAAQEGKFTVPAGNSTSSEPLLDVDRHYHVQAKGGSHIIIAVDVVPMAEGRPMDPVVSISDRDGVPYRTCRNPGDDYTRTPGLSDATPDAFDDICVNDDIRPGQNTNSRLEIRVPGKV